MRSISGMPSDDLAGDACQYIIEEEGKCAAFLECLPTTWQVTRSDACQYIIEEEIRWIEKRFYQK